MYVAPQQKPAEGNIKNLYPKDAEFAGAAPGWQLGNLVCWKSWVSGRLAKDLIRGRNAMMDRIYLQFYIYTLYIYTYIYICICIYLHLYMRPPPRSGLFGKVFRDVWATMYICVCTVV